MRKGFLIVSIAALVAGILGAVSGCGENTGPSNQDFVKDYKVPPSNNPEVKGTGMENQMGSLIKKPGGKK
jgi:hypothetical protein